MGLEGASAKPCTATRCFVCYWPPSLVGNGMGWYNMVLQYGMVSINNIVWYGGVVLNGIVLYGIEYRIVSHRFVLYCIGISTVLYWTQ